MHFAVPRQTTKIFQTGAMNTSEVHHFLSILIEFILVTDLDSNSGIAEMYRPLIKCIFFLNCEIFRPLLHIKQIKNHKTICIVVCHVGCGSSH